MNDKKILIVDFDTESLIALSNLVYEEGFQAETATDGLAAYEKFRSGNFDLVILEPMLPKLHGFDLCRRIVNNPAKKVPIIIVTAIYREPSCRHEALNVNGAAAFFTKPYNREELRSKMLQLLVEGQERAPLKAAEPAVVPAKGPARVQAAVLAAPPASSPAVAAPRSLDLDLRDILGTKPAARETKPARPPIMDIEKELQEAVSGLVSPVKKKEVRVAKEPETRPVREEPPAPRENREPRDRGDRDIDVLLKDAIGGLAMPRKKKKPEVSVLEARLPAGPKVITSEPAVRPVPAGRPDVRVGQPEKIPVAKEIKQGLPFQAGKPNNVPRPSSRLNFEKQSVPFDIDKTLIEIDKIPLDIAKPVPEDERLADNTLSHEKKRGLFEEYSEPAKKKMSFAIIGAAAGALLIATSAAFFILKSKKPGPPPSSSVASVQKSLPAEVASRRDDAKPYPDAQEAELKPEPKRVVTKPVEQPPVDIGAPIQPSSLSEGAPVQIQDQPVMSNAAAPKTGAGTTDQVQSGGQAEAPQPPAKEASATADPGKSPSPAPEKAKEGALIPLDQVDAAPALIKRVDPKYPPLAIRSGVGGTVTVNVLISDKGDVLRTEILKGVKNGFGIEAAAETAIRLWKFRPAQKDGANVKVWKSFDINFKPNPKSS